jgi:uncharacterized protein (TIGR02246 family)
MHLIVSVKLGTRATVLVALATLARVAAVPAQPPSQPASGDEAAIQAFYRDWSAATARDGAAGYIASWADDGVLLPPDEPPASGKEAIRAWYERAAAPFVVQPSTFSVEALHVMGGWAVYRFSIAGQRTPRAGGDPQPFAAKYLDVLRRGEDGAWRFVYRMWNANPHTPAR